ncbi:MAG: hypothetical protein J6O88_10275 [Chryseobacterium sp.]|uniref:DUF6046 domain-containing protein n=1 Tax=Chryseobacterium sp. TaxID=1871047 RepID=UPI001B238BBE|nr:DUF6046 domain-containing protein [Chryseobacterium sp.]MBO6185052.1 hypothetical protein [Chryseobacterium sp.]
MNLESKETRLNTLLMRFMIYPKIEISEDEKSYSIVDLLNRKFKEILLKECIITVSQEKNIISTTIQGRSGTIKEYISDDDYQITLDIGLSNFDFNKELNSFDYPISTVEEFLEMLRLAVPITLHSDFLMVFGIETAIVKSYNLQQETYSNRQSIVVNMISDSNYYIKKKEQE